MRTRSVFAVTVTAAAASIASVSLTAPASADTGDLSPGRDAKTLARTVTAEQMRAATAHWTDDRLTNPISDAIDGDTLPAPGKILTPAGDRLGYGRPALPYSRGMERGVGKVAFTTRGKDNTCTGSAIGGNLVLTDAHCVLRHGGASEPQQDMVFFPDLYGKVPSKPFGIWAVKKSFVLADYVNGDDDDYVSKAGSDVAILQVAPSATGRTLASTLGKSYKTVQTTNRGPVRGVTFGYPATGGKKFSGTEMFYCVGKLRTDTAVKPAGFKTDNCAGRGGHSGGPLFGPRGNIVGVVTYSMPRTDANGRDTSQSMHFARLSPDTFGRLLKEAKTAD